MFSKVDRSTLGAGPKYWEPLETIELWKPWTFECDIPASHSTFQYENGCRHKVGVAPQLYISKMLNFSPRPFNPERCGKGLVVYRQLLDKFVLVFVVGLRFPAIRQFPRRVGSNFRFFWKFRGLCPHYASRDTVPSCLWAVIHMVAQRRLSAFCCVKTLK